MYRDETGWIRFDWGDPGNPGADFKGGHGLSHIAAKHPEDLKALPNTLANGEVRRHEDPSKLYVVTDTHFAVLAPLHGGAKKTITEFAPTRAGEIARIRKNPLAKKPEEN